LKYLYASCAYKSVTIIYKASYVPIHSLLNLFTWLKATLAHLRTALNSIKYFNVQVPFAKEGTRQYGSEIALHPNGRFLYVSNRGDGAILVFEVKDEGSPLLEQKYVVPSGGTWPRHFALLGNNHLLSADQFNHKVKQSLNEQWKHKIISKGLML